MKNGWWWFTTPSVPNTYVPNQDKETDSVKYCPIHDYAWEIAHQETYKKFYKYSRKDIPFHDKPHEICPDCKLTEGLENMTIHKLVTIIKDILKSMPKANLESGATRGTIANKIIKKISEAQNCK